MAGAVQENTNVIRDNGHGTKDTSYGTVVMGVTSDTDLTKFINVDENGNLKSILVNSSGSDITSHNPLPVTKGFNIPIYDYTALTYVAAGNGAGEIETVTFKTGGAGGTTVATLTLTYNADNELATVTQS